MPTPRSSNSSFLALLLVSACAHAPSAASASPDAAARPGGPMTRVIEVSAQGEAERAPDVATFRIGVEIEAAATVEAARQGAAAAMQRMLDALDRLGVEAGQRRTTSLVVQPQYAYVNRERELQGYLARHDLQVRVTDLDRAAEIIDGALKAGGDAARFDGIEFELDRPDEARAEARAEAVRRARRAAEELAQAAGERLGPVLLIREGGEGSGPHPPPMPMAAMRGAEAKATPIEPGRLTVTVDVFTRWAIDGE